MPRLILFILKHILLGSIVGWLFVAGLLWFDVAGFGTLVLQSPSKWVALALLGVFFAITFGSASVATAVLSGHEFIDDDGGDAGESIENLELQPVRITER